VMHAVVTHSTMADNDELAVMRSVEEHSTVAGNDKLEAQQLEFDTFFGALENAIHDAQDDEAPLRDAVWRRLMGETDDADLWVRLDAVSAPITQKSWSQLLSLLGFALGVIDDVLASDLADVIIAHLDLRSLLPPQAASALHGKKPRPRKKKKPKASKEACGQGCGCTAEASCPHGAADTL